MNIKIRKKYEKMIYKKVTNFDNIVVKLVFGFNEDS